MDTPCSDLEFFDLTNASDEEAKEIRAILNECGSNGCVELPWEIPLNFIATTPSKINPSANEKPCETSATCTRLSGAVMGQALLYAPPPMPTVVPTQTTQHSVQSTDVIPSIESTFLPPISAASAIAPHYPAPYLVPRTLPYLRAYHHVGVPLFTCTLPNSGELTHVPSPYAPFLPLAAPTTALPQPHIEKLADVKEEIEGKQKVRSPSERQFSRRGRKKPVASGNYYSSSEFGQGSDAYPESIAVDDQTLVSASIGSDRISAVPSSLPVVPVHVPPSTFPVTSGTIPMHTYPPGLHPLSYSQLSGPQAHAAPLYYVPVFNHAPYTGYIPTATGPVMLPVGSVGVPSTVHHTNESACSLVNDVTESNGSLAASSSESIEKASSSSNAVESDCDVSSLKKPNNNQYANSHDKKTGQTTTIKSSDVVNSDEPPMDSCQVNAEVSAHVNPKVTMCQEELPKNASYSVHQDNSRCWADLFKKQNPEVNGLEQQTVDIEDHCSVNEQTFNKEINGKLYTVPNNDNVL